MVSQKKILLIDDEEIVRRMLASFLAPFYQVKIAADAFEALGLLFGMQAEVFPNEYEPLKEFLIVQYGQFFSPATNPSILKLKPDLIIADIKMPDINGFQLIQILRQYLPKVPVYMITGYETEGHEKQVTQLNIREILLKPFSPMILLDKINATLAK